MTNQYSGSVSEIDTKTNTVVATVTVGGYPTGVAITPNGKHIYVVNNNVFQVLSGR